MGEFVKRKMTSLQRGLAPDNMGGIGSSDFSSVDMSSSNSQPVPQMDVERGPSSFGNVQTTLTEPVSETLMRDVRMVGNKIGYVIWPRPDSMKELSRNWDLWGPLALCLLLSIVLSINAPDDQKALVFAAVFVIVWLGSAIVTVNALLLGGSLSFFHSVCVLGYCVFPIDVAAILCTLWGNALFKMIIVPACFVWATGASVGFLTELVPPKRAVLALYPVGLFYLSISWIVFVE